MSSHVITVHKALDGRKWVPVCRCGWTGVVTKTPETALRVGNSDHVDKQKKPCPTPGKKRFRTQAAAERELEVFWRTASKGKTMPCRTYKCDCRRWHLTAEPLSQFKERQGATA